METIAETIVYLDADVLPVRNPYGLFDMLPSNKTSGVCGSIKFFNSGVFLFRSSMEIFRQLQRRIETNDYRKNNDPTAQDVLISHLAQSNTTILIPDDYNYRPLHHQAGLSENARIVHWIGNPKPWTDIIGKKTSI
jgi:lipopolysaccharide biosynthesis glycosyltransferase